MAWCLTGVFAGVTAAEPPVQPGVLDEVLVTGERPGPGMWRVSKGDHELWILGTLEPLTKDMTWRSQSVETRIAASQNVLAIPDVEPHVGFFRSLTLVPSLLHARKSPDGRTLEAELPHELYMRWLALRVKYLGNGGGDEKMRPLIAALDLYTHAIDQSGLTSEDKVWPIVEHIARKSRVPITPVTLKLEIEDPKGTIRQLEQIPPDAEVTCLATTIARMETDLPAMRQRANFWSLGDIAGLRSLPYVDERIACLDAFFSVPDLRAQLTRARAQLIDLWLTAAKDSLNKNASTFAVLPIAELLKSDGWLAKLRDQGYAIRDP